MRTNLKTTSKTVTAIIWFPLFFCVGFLVFYFVPLHRIAPHHLPVAVVGQPAETQLKQEFDTRSPGSYTFTAVATTAEARTKLLDRDVDGALELTSRQATLYLAGADGSSIKPILEDTFAPVATAAHVPLRIVDVAPLNSGDSGTSFFYVALVCNLVAYVLVMFAVQQAQFGRARTLTLLTVFGAVLSGVIWPIVWTTGVLPEKPAIIPLTYLLTQAISWTAYGLVPLARRAVPALLLLLFVLLSISSSGGIVPAGLLPGFYQVFQPIMPLGSYLSAGRGILYLDDHALLQPVLTLFAWLLVGVALVVYGGFRARNAARRRAAAEDRAGASVPLPAPARSPSPQPETEPPADGEDSQAWVVVYGSVLDERGRTVSAGTVSTTNAAGHPLTRAEIREDGSYATLLPVGAGTVVVVTAFGAEHGVGATPVRTVAGQHRVRAEVQLLVETNRRIAQERYDAAAAAAAGALGGTV